MTNYDTLFFYRYVEEKGRTLQTDIRETGGYSANQESDQSTNEAGV